MAKPIFKVAVRCPHCGGEQLEPELAKSTFCRSCSQYFAITPAALAAARPKEALKTKPAATSAAPGRAPAARLETSPSGTPAVGGGLLQKIEGLFGKPKVRIAHCFECTSNQEVSGNSHSTTCRACGAYIDLQDYKITGSFSRNIKTRGSLYLSSKGDLSSSKITCTDAVIHGKMRGNMHCLGKVTIKYQGRLQGTLEAGTLMIEKGSEVVFSRPVKVGGVTIAGKMEGHILSSSHITILKTGSLEGGVVATGFNVDRGGSFEGELTISPRGVPAPEIERIREDEARNGPRAIKSTAELDAFLAGEHNPIIG